MSANALKLTPGSYQETTYSDAASSSVDWPSGVEIIYVYLDGSSGGAHVRTGGGTDEATGTDPWLPVARYFPLVRSGKGDTKIHVLGSTGSTGTLRAMQATPTDSGFRS